ncbi:family 16 glycoside hydrolase [Arthrobacter sp. NicSoilB8]|uniref:family 16 glycoside hydrolase n=1 Tax=Arthrobacter sp. NicSoilB8 TaxID=2830998 RepID=UPI001CC68AA4|nr:family 16 glycoside hydrolase [Arthrobacter sp. NicSoilB8]
MGRYLCNTLQEALDSTVPTVAGKRRDFDVVVIGGGSFGSVVANGLFMRDPMRSRRILVLEQGPFVLPEHVQNLPFMGGEPGMRVPWVVRPNSDLGYAGLLYALGGRSLAWGGWSPEFLQDEPPGADEQVVPGGNEEMSGWPPGVISELQDPYFYDAGDQIGVNSTNDFVYGPLHQALRQMLFDGIVAGSGAGLPFASLPLSALRNHPVVRAFRRRNGRAPTAAELGEFLSLELNGGVPAPSRADLLNMLKLEAPLAVQSVADPGLFPVNKFSAMPLLVQASRSAAAESDGVGTDADARKRLMVVPKCQVLELVTETQQDNWVRVTGVRVMDDAGNERVVPLAPPMPDGRQSAVVLALGTIETTRVALTTFKSSLAGRAAGRMGKNLIAHLRSNLNIRIPRASIAAALPALGPAALRALQVSALFIKGRVASGSVDRYFHLQITASGLGRFGNNSEAELFKKVPSLEQLRALQQADDSTVVITLRGIGEMTPQNPDSFVALATSPADAEYGRPKAFVDIGDSRQPAGGSPATQLDRDIWEAMDSFTDDVALIFANGQPFEIIVAAGAQTIPVPAGATAADLATLHPYGNRRDRLGTTHHEAGTLWMNDDPGQGVTNGFGRVHDTTNCYVAGPALFPRSGSPNPMLTGTALSRRTVTLLADQVLPRPQAFTLAAPWRVLFDGTARSFNTDWTRTSPDASNGFALIDGEIVTYGDRDFGLLYYSREAFDDFTLRVQFRIADPSSHNSGIFVRFQDPTVKPTQTIAQRIQDAGDGKQFAQNRAWGAVHSGFEIQIDDLAKGDPRRDFYGLVPEPNGLRKNRTGAIYKIPAGDSIPSGGFDAALQAYQPGPNLVPGRWYEYEIDVRGDNYTVDLTDLESGAKTRTTTFKNTDPARGISSMGGRPAGYIGLQSYSGAAVAFRHIAVKP